MKLINKPKAEEFPAIEPMLANLVPDDGRLLAHMRVNFQQTKQFLLPLREATLLHRYAADKWTIKEVLMHLIDMERIYAYRALRFARNDQTELPGFDGNKYVYSSSANKRSIPSLLKEFEAVRNATVSMVETFDDEALARTGRANGNPASVRAVIYHIAGHEVHHIQLVKERYLP